MGRHAAFGTGWHALFGARGSGLTASSRHRRICSDLWRSGMRIGRLNGRPRDNRVGAGSYFSFLTRLKQAAVNPVITVHAITRKTHPPVVNSAACCSMGSEFLVFLLKSDSEGFPRTLIPAPVPVKSFPSGFPPWNARYPPGVLPTYDQVLRVSLPRFIFVNL